MESKVLPRAPSSNKKPPKPHPSVLAREAPKEMHAQPSSPNLVPCNVQLHHIQQPSEFLNRALFKGGNGRGGFHTRVRGTMFVCDGAVTPRPSRKCDITSPPLLRDDKNLRDNRVTVQWRRAVCRASPYRHPGCHANVVPPG